MMSQDNRRHPRFDALNLLHFTALAGDRPVIQSMGRTLNVSESGILLETYVPLEDGQSIQLTIGLEDELVVIEGRAVYCKQAPGDAYTAGIDFSQMPELSRQLLERYIQLFEQRLTGNRPDIQRPD